MTTTCNNKTKFGKVCFNTVVQDHVGAETFTGSGLNDCAVTAPSTNKISIPDDFTLVVQIDGEGSPDTFKYSVNGGSSWLVETINCSTTGTTIAYGLLVTFPLNTGHTSGDRWSYPIYSYKAHEPQTLKTCYTRWVETVMPVEEPVATETQENKQTGSLQPKDVDYSGLRTPIPIVLNKAGINDVLNYVKWVFGDTTALSTSAASAVGDPDNSVYQLPTRCAGIRLGEDVAWKRLYGMAPSNVNITLPAGEGGFCRISADIIGIGKTDNVPDSPTEVSGDLADEQIDVTTAVYGGLVKHVRQIWAIDENDDVHYVTPISVDSVDQSLININPIDRDGSGTSCTFYVTYVKATDLDTEADWAYNLEANEDPETIKALKASQLKKLVIGGTFAGFSESTPVTNGHRLRCDIEGDIQINIDGRAYVKTCPDGVIDEAGNMILTDGATVTIAFSQQIYDLFYQYLAKNPTSALAPFPIWIQYEDLDANTLDVIIPKCKLVSANPSDMGGRTGQSLQPVILDDGTNAVIYFKAVVGA